MKHILLFTFLLMGLAILDWSCGPGWNGGDAKPSHIIGIDTITYTTGTNGYSSYQFEGDSIPYDSLFILVSFKDALFAKYYSGSAIYATPPAMPPHTEWKPDSIHVFNKGERIDSMMVMQNTWYSEYFIGLDSFTSQWYGNSHIPLSYYFKFNIPPSQRDTFKFDFKFYYDEGEVFEEISEPIIILP